MSADASEGPRITRRRGACAYCRKKKIRCNGELPCRLCQRHGINCSYLSTNDSASNRQAANAPQRPGTSGSIGCFSKGGKEQHRNHGTGRSRTHNRSSSCLSSEADSIDWFLNLGTPMTGTFEHIPDDFLLTPLRLQEPPTPISQNTINGGGSYFEPDYLEAYPPPLDETESTPIGSGAHLEPTLDEHEPLIDLTKATTPRDNALQMQDDTTTILPETFSREKPPVRIQNIETRKRPCSITEQTRTLFPALLQTTHDNGAARLRFDEPYISPLISALSTAKIDEVSRQTTNRVIRYVMSQECQRSLPAAWSSVHLQRSGKEIRWANLPVETLVSSCFEEPLGVSLYLQQSDILSGIKGFNSPFGLQSAVEKCLLTTLLAWGSSVQAHQCTPDSVVELLTLMADAYGALSAEPDSLDKFFATVAVLQLIQKLGLGLLPKLLGALISMIQTMSLHSEAAVESLCAHSRGLATRVKRACWVVYIVDKVNTLRWMSFSLFPDLCLQYAPPPMNDCSEDQDWMLAQWRYATICAEIHAEISRPQSDKSQHLRNAASIAAKLHAWYDSLPEEGDPQSKKCAMSYHAGRRLRICMLYQYYEANLALLGLDQTTREGSFKYRASRSRILSLIKEIFHVSNKIEPEDVICDRIFLFLPSLGLCKMTTELLLHGNESLEDGRAVLAVAHGYFARTSSMLPTPEFFNQVTELIDVAVKAHKSRG